METPYFKYIENVCPGHFEFLYEDMIDKFGEGTKRRSCLFNLHSIDIFQKGYTNIPYYLASEVPKSLDEIRTIVEKITGQIFDYVLVHLYENGKSGISWHNDSEAHRSYIASLSLGATRKFRFKEIGKRTGYDYEFSLKSGDLLVMNKRGPENDFIGCQDKFYHTVPQESKLKEPRINLTFRE